MTYGRNGMAAQLSGQRAGVCHRCGWRGIVGKVRRQDRDLVPSPQHYGRLCQECFSDLFRAAPAAQRTAAAGPAHARHHVGAGRQMAWTTPGRPASLL